MQRHDGLTALCLGILLTASLLAWAPTAKAASGTVITDQTTWAGYNAVAGDITIMSGAKLVLEPGTILNLTEDSILIVEGTLEVRGTAENPTTIYGSHIAPTSNSARWEGIQVTQMGSMSTKNLILSDARGGIHVLGSLDVQGATLVRNTTVGFYIEGSMTVTGGAPACDLIGNACLLVEGTMSSATLDVTNSSRALVSRNGGSATVATLSATAVGIAIEVTDGSTVDVGTMKLDDVMAGVLASGAVAADIDTIIAEGAVGTGLDVTDVSGIDVEEMRSDGGVWTRLLRGSSIHGLSVGDIDATGASDGAWGIEVDVAGNASIGGGNLTGYTNGVLVRGSGSTDLGELNISAVEVALSASGGGDLTADSGNWSDAVTIASITCSSSVLTTMTLYGSSTTETGIEYITGSHSLPAVSIQRPYHSQDRISVGIRALWSDLDVDAATLVGWHRGVVVEQDAALSSTSLSVTDGGRDEGASLQVYGGDAAIDSLDTSSAEHGIDLLAGSAHIGAWTAANHRDHTLAMADGTTAVIRSLPAFATNGPYDAFGDGSLLWGGSTSARVQVTSADHLTESTVTVTDLSAVVVPDVTVTAHGFTATTDASGQVTLPLLANGSDVSAVATDGTGTSVSLSSPSGTVQLPLLPEVGEWVITSGVDAELHGGTFALPGNLTIESSASLKLVDATLTLPANGTFTATGSGELFGVGGTISGGAGSHSTAGHPYAGEAAGLTIAHPVSLACSSQISMTGVAFTDQLSLGDGCTVRVFGSIEGDVTLGTGAEAEVISGLQLRVLDKGVPVMGAAVHVQGQDLTTDSAGIITTSAQARLIDSTGISETGTLAVNIVHSGVSEWKAWDTSETVSMDVMVSTLEGGIIDGWTRIDATFSPYHLANDLTVPTGRTLQLLQGSSIAISNTSSILVAGSLVMDDATLTGSNWLALRVTGQASIDGGQISGGSIVVESTGTADLVDVIVTGSEVSVSGGEAALTLTGGIVMQAERCLRADGAGTLLSLHGTTLQACDQHALWATESTVELTDVVLAAGSGTGLWLQRASGNVTGLNATAHDGDGPVLRLDAIDSLKISGGAMRSGGTSPAITIDHSDAIDLRLMTILGAPALLIEESAGDIADLILDGEGSNGSGIEVFGSTADPLALHELDVAGHQTALNLRGGVDDADNPPIETTDCILNGATSIDADGLPFLSSGDDLSGAVLLDATTKRFIGTIIDSEPASFSVAGNAVLRFGMTHSLIIVDDLAAAIPNATANISVPSFSAELPTQQIDGVDDGSTFVVIHRIVTETEDRTTSSGYYSASADSHLPIEGAFAIGASAEATVRVMLQANDPPQAMILEPDGAVNQPEGQNIILRAAGTDPDTGHAEALTFAWYLTGVGDSSLDTPMMTGFQGSVFIEQGEWTLWLVVTDPVGATATDSIAVTITPPDNDLDFISTCPVDGASPWYDLTELRHCGPDLWDLDDDNDGWKDDQDAFPKDACAAKDTDDDGLPDSIEEGCTTTLTADDDDDNDGIPDTHDPAPTKPGTGSEEVESSNLVKLFSPGVILPVLAAFAVIGFLMRQRIGGSGSADSDSTGSSGEKQR